MQSTLDSCSMIESERLISISTLRFSPPTLPSPYVNHSDILGWLLYCHGNIGPGNFGPPDQYFRWKIWSAFVKLVQVERRSFYVFFPE